MRKKQKSSKPRVLFNASVVLAGVYSSKGGSAKIVKLVKGGKLEGVVSEVILDEIRRHTDKFSLSNWDVVAAPSEKMVAKYNRVVTDEGDSHVLAACEENKIKYLVTLDKKHLLVLKGKIRGLKILTPGELIEFLSEP